MKISIVSLMILFMGFTVLSDDQTNTKNNNENQKSFLENANALMADDYKKEWKEIDSLISELLPKSALEKVESLYAKVENSTNHAQYIKCIIYKNKLLIEIEDKDPSQAILRLEESVNSENNDVAQSIMNSMLAELYFLYAQRNRYRIQNRTFTVEEPTDVATWSLTSLIKKSNDLYLSSITELNENPQILEEYSSILYSSKESLDFKPDINSFLMHRVVMHFSNSQSLLTEPVNAFKMEDPDLLLDFEKFIVLEIETQDTSSYKYHALKTYQKLLNYLSETGQLEELVYTDLARIKFVHQHLSFDNKDELYLSSLDQLKEQYRQLPIYTEINYRLASYYKSQGDRYRNGFDKKYKGLNAKALGIAKESIVLYPNSFGAKNCQNLIDELNRKDLGVKVEEVITSNQAFLTHTSFRNVESVTFRIYAITRDQLNTIQRSSRKDKLKMLGELKSVRQVSQPLSAPDYDYHAVEHVMEGLDYGHYLMVASDQSRLSTSELISFTNLIVSDIGYATQNRKGHLDILVYNRVTGKPIPDAKVEVYESKWNNNETRTTLLATLFTDGHGKCTFFKTDKSVSIKIQHKKDHLDLNEQHYLYNGEERDSYKHCHLFTDRNIYRPGQKIFFKGLFVKMNKASIPSVRANKQVTISLKDPNYQLVKEISYTTNEYGTFNGNFDIPTSGLNGSFLLEVTKGGDHVGSMNVRVEDYKRPKFEVIIDTLDVEYKLGDTVAVTGVAKMFAGSPLDEVKVRYRITRSKQQPYWSWWRPQPNLPDQEIANGETQTGQDGSFEIEVPLIAGGESTHRSTIYNYKVSVDVIDIGGETQSASTSIRASETSVIASLDLGKEVNLEDVKKVKIKTENINGKRVNANGTIKIEKLQSDTKFYAKRYWGLVDTTLYAEAEWLSQVPQYQYQSKKNFDQLKVEKQIMLEGFNTANSVVIDLTNRLEVGIFKISTHVGDDSSIQYVTINDFEDAKFVSEELLYYQGLKSSYQPGEEVALQLGSAEQDLRVYVEATNEGKIKSSKWLKLEGKEVFKFKLDEKDRGGVFVKVQYALNNRTFNKVIKVNVPWTNKELKIEYTSIRNKIAPGAEEKWQIKISGDKKDKVNAELLATMYDASLDQFAGEHRWRLNLYPEKYNMTAWNPVGFRIRYFNQISAPRYRYQAPVVPSYPNLNWFGLKSIIGVSEWRNNKSMLRGRAAGVIVQEVDETPTALPELDEVMIRGYATVSKSDMASVAVTESMDQAADFQDQNAESEDIDNADSKNAADEFDNFSPRTNLNETVFFFPDMNTDEEGNIMLNFTMNEALTKWTFMTLAHTTDLEYGFAEEDITTFKNLMVFPNPPRFMRQGDQLSFTAKVQNMSEETITADTKIELIDAVTEANLIDQFGVTSDMSSLSIAPQSSELLTWTFDVPNDFVGLVKYRILASDGTYTDGEENYIQTLTNRMLVTETMPMNVNGKASKTFNFESFKDKSKSSSLTHSNFSIEFTSNPAWYAIQAMPYLMEYPHDCSEQLFNRYFANSLSSHIANANPRIQQVFDAWKTVDKDALLSNLSKNQELKSALLEETPWVLHAKSEEAQKQNLALLFDLNKMSHEQDMALSKLVKRQSSSGGFSWFPGGRESRYITQYVVEGIGHLEELVTGQQKVKSQQILGKAIRYTDNELSLHYQKLLERIEEMGGKKEDRHISSLDVHYLYARSYHLDTYPPSNNEAYNYFLDQAKEYWKGFGLYEQAMIALVMHRNKNGLVANNILRSIKERSINHEELGRYWKLDRGYRWNQHPIETQSLMIELFSEMDAAQDIIDELRVWLLKNKQTNSWKTTKSTAAAIYALMINKDQSLNSWLLDNEQVAVSIGEQSKAVKFDKAQAGTLYTKKSFEKSEINDEFSIIEVTNPNDVISWGSAYWQYFEDLDKIKTFEDTPLKLKKNLYIETMTNEGPVLGEVSTSNPIKQGDKVRVRIELRVDRTMEFVHMKDMRASGFEPTSVLSQHKYQDGLSYYESTRDVATDFFFSYLPKGTFVFEYDLRATHKGGFSNGITTIQSMYAPEFSSHSEGVEVTIN